MHQNFIHIIFLQGLTDKLQTYRQYVQNVLRAVVFNFIQYKVFKHGWTLGLGVWTNCKDVGDAKLIKNDIVACCRVSRLKETRVHLVDVCIIRSLSECTKKWIKLFDH